MCFEEGQDTGDWCLADMCFGEVKTRVTGVLLMCVLKRVKTRETAWCLADVCFGEGQDKGDWCLADVLSVPQKAAADRQR